MYSSEPLEIEQRLHGQVVLALADEDLSEVRVQLNGRKVSLSGPEELLPAAEAVAKSLSGVRRVESQIVEPYLSNAVVNINSSENSTENFVRVIHPDDLFWPNKNEGVDLVESELLVTKIHRSIEINGAVPNNQIKQAILAEIEQFIEIPEHLFDVTVNKIKDTPDWYLQDLPLILPFVQWVEEGQIQYRGNRIQLDGTVLNNNAWNAIETAIANISSTFQIENRLQIETQ